MTRRSTAQTKTTALAVIEAVKSGRFVDAASTLLLTSRLKTGRSDTLRLISARVQEEARREAFAAVGNEELSNVMWYGDYCVVERCVQEIEIEITRLSRVYGKTRYSARREAP